MKKTQILIINWNNGSDTVLCLRSVVSLDNVKVLVLDNFSTDDSIQIICNYLETEIINYEVVALSDLNNKNEITSKVLLVRASENLGFAKGNNVLFNYILKFRTAKYAWLLNNDAIAGKDALLMLQKKMDEDKQTAFAGSVILDYYKPELIQCCGVKYFKYLGISKLILKNENWDKIDKSKIPIDEIDFQHGASLLVRLDLLDKIGLMDERFFLYSEEHDWQYTAEEMGYKNVLAKESLVYHKGSMGTSTKKHLFFYYYNRSAMLFAKKHSNAFIVFLVIFTITGITIVRTKFYLKSLLWGMKGLMEGLLKY